VPARQPISDAHRLLIKVGTRVLAGGDAGVDREQITALVRQIAALRDDGREVLLVSTSNASDRYPYTCIYHGAIHSPFDTVDCHVMHREHLEH